MIVADSGAVYALYDADDAHYLAVRDTFRRVKDTIHIPSGCLAEVDFLLRTRLGLKAELDFLASLSSGRMLLERLERKDIERCAELLKKYENLNIGLSDASVVAVAERLGTRRLLTVDRRDFELIRARDGSHFEILPERARRRSAG